MGLTSLGKEGKRLDRESFRKRSGRRAASDGEKRLWGGMHSKDVVLHEAQFFSVQLYEAPV
jgi:hypothetical protein